MKKAIQYFALFLLLAVLALVSLEILLRISGLYSSYFEKNYNTYKSYYESDCNSEQIYTREKNSEISIEQNEFSYKRITNNWGLSQYPFPDTSNAYFALILGDSFTEGIGSSIDSTWPKFLETLYEPECKLATYNAGVAGSDIYYMRKLYEEKLQLLNPDVLVLCLNYSDISESIYRGGKERFTADGRTCFPKGPDWEIYYEKSHVVRFFVHFIMQYDFTLSSKKTLKKKLPKILENMATEINWLNQNTKDLVVILHPYPYFKDKKVPFHNDFQDIATFLRPSIKVINLYPDFEKYFAKNKASDYYWEKDGHFNSKGYLLMSKFIHAKMAKLDFCK